jgi:hypothetical protein
MLKQLQHRDEFPRLMAELHVESAVEVGSAYGYFARKLLECETLKELILVDPWLDENHWLECQRLADEDERVNLVRTTSVHAAKLVRSVDFVYIDADHSYAAVCDDLEAWWPKVKKLMAGHDYALTNHVFNTPLGVIAAVEQFFEYRPDVRRQENELVYVTGAGGPTIVQRLQAATAADVLHDLGPWSSHLPSWYVFKEQQA